MKRTTRSLALAVAALVSLAACSNGSDGSAGVGSPPPADTTAALTVWLMEDSASPAVVDLVNTKFAKDYPNVTVDVQRQQWGGIQDKLATSLGTESTPDVVEIGNTLTASYAAAGLLADLSPAEELRIEGMLPGAQPSGEYNGTRYGVPFYGGVKVVVYSRSQFADAGVSVPTSLAELDDVAAALQGGHADNADYSAFYFPGRSWYGAVPFVWDAGGEIAEQDGTTWTGTLDQPAAVAGLTTLAELVTKYSRAPADADESKNLDAFQAGNVGMMIDSWWVPGALDTGDRTGDIGAFAIPGTEPGSRAPVFFGGSDLAVSSSSPNPALAREWLRILTGVKAQTQLAADAGTIPNQEGAFAGHAGDPFLTVADAAATTSRFTPVSPNWPGVEASQVLPDMLESIMSGSASVEDATGAASEQITGILNG